MKIEDRSSYPEKVARATAANDVWSETAISCGTKKTTSSQPTRQSSLDAECRLNHDDCQDCAAMDRAFERPGCLRAALSAQRGQRRPRVGRTNRHVRSRLGEEEHVKRERAFEVADSVTRRSLRG